MSEVILHMHIEVQVPVHVHEQNLLGGRTLNSDFLLYRSERDSFGYPKTSMSFSGNFCTRLSMIIQCS